VRQKQENRSCKKYWNKLNKVNEGASTNDFVLSRGWTKHRQILGTTSGNPALLCVEKFHYVVTAKLMTLASLKGEPVKLTALNCSRKFAGNREAGKRRGKISPGAKRKEAAAIGSFFPCHKSLTTWGTC
jgi:hypothetical protein